MYKKLIKNVLLVVIVFFGFNNFVDALSIYDYLKSGDIIIGNTTFRNGTWISATRASKAGSLYTLTNQDTDVRTFKYINKDLWYEMDPDTDKYRVLSKSEIEDLNNSLYINYLNNEPLTKTYKIHTIEENEFSGYSNAVGNFFNSLDGEIIVEDSDVVVDYKNQTITCPFNTIFQFRVISDVREDFYTGFCDSEFNFLPQENEPLPDIDTSMKIVSSNLAVEDEFLNQDKVTLTGRSYTNIDGDEIYFPANNISFEINEKFEKFSLYEDSEELKYLVFDFELDENNTTDFIRGIISYEENYEYEIIDEHNFRLYVEIEDRWNNHQQYFLLNYNDKYIGIDIDYIGLELSDKDFELKSLKLADIDVEDNNQSFVDNIEYEESTYTDEDGYTYKDKYYNIYTIGYLNNFDYNDYYGNWIALELEFDSDIYLDEIEIFSYTDDANYFYEIVNDKILLWIDADTFEYSNSIGFSYGYTNGNMVDDIEIRVNSYYESMYVDYDKEILGIYTYEYYDDEEIKVQLEPVTSYWSNYSDLYYKKDEQKLYYKDISTVLFKDSESFKELNIIDGEVYISELVGIWYDIYDDSTIQSSTMVYGNSNFDSFENFDDNFEQEEGVSYQLYYFFNREKTEAELETISNLEELGVELVDLSDYYYGDE